MTIKAKLQFGNNDLEIYNKEYLIVDCTVHSFRDHDAFFPIAASQNEYIEITLSALNNNDLSLQEWYVSQTRESGRVMFEMIGIDDLVSETRVIKFENAACYSFSEKYDIDSKINRRLIIRLVADKIVMDDVEFSR